MGYCFKDHETVPEGIKRIAIEEFNKAVAKTKPKVKNRDEAIHGARVSLKKLRALLRFARTKDNADVFRHENACYREAGKRLSEVRDATAMIEAFDQLTKHYAEQLAPDAFAEVRKPIFRIWMTQQSNQRKAISEVAQMFKSARSRVTDWPIDDNSFSALRQGLKRSYKHGRTTMTQAQTKPSVENFHEWRKRVKDLWYQVRVLEPTWPAMLKDMADELGRLADYLSEDHDLSILRQTVLQQSPEDRTQLEALVALIDQRRGELEIDAKWLGKRMYVEKPNAFTRRFDVYWRAWCAEATSDPIAGT